MNTPVVTAFAPTGPLEFGTTVLEASAGTGKTYSITSIFVRLVIEHGVPVEEILAVTFTNAATAELTTRIRKRLGEALVALDRDVREGGRTSSNDDVLELLLRLARENPERELFAGRARTAVESFDRAQISTIHGFCQRMLQQHALEAQVPFGVTLLEDQKGLHDEIAMDFWSGELARLETFELQLLTLSGLNAENVKRLVRTAIDNWEAEPTPAPAPEARPESGELIAALREASEEARRPGAIENLEEKLAQSYTRGLRKIVKALEALGRGLPSDEDIEHLATIPRPRSDASPLERTVARLLEERKRWLPRGNRWVLEVKRGLVQYARREYDRRARDRGLLSFDDLLRRLKDALFSGDVGVSSALERAVGSRFSAVLIDEFQDTDPVQWAIFQRLFGSDNHRLFLIGDPKQAIYSFRRADVNTYLSARSKAKRIQSLTQNWRSDPPFITALNAIFTRDGRNAFAHETITYEEVGAADKEVRVPAVGAPVRLQWVTRNEGNTAGSRKGDPGTNGMRTSTGEEELPAIVASDIVRFLERRVRMPGAEGRAVKPSDIAVLVPKNKHASAMQRALQEKGVPAVIHGPYSVFETAEAEELEAVLAAILEPSNIRAVKKALLTRLIGVTANELVKMEAEDPKTFEAWVDKLRAWRDDWNSRSFIEGFRKLVSHRVEALLRLADGERRLANLLQLGEILHLAASQRGLKAPGLFAWYQRQLAADKDEKNQVRLETDEPAVQIVTIHKAKGLEYPFVWCPYLWQKPQSPAQWRKSEEFVFRKGKRVLLEIDEPDSSDRKSHIADKNYELRTEQLRQLYVALTRARHQVTIHAGAYYDLQESALGYLLFAPGKAQDAQGLANELDAKKSRLYARRDDDLKRLAVRGFDEALVSIGDAAPPLDRRAELDPEPTELAARQYARKRRLDTDWRRTSFSGLAAELARAQHFDEERVQAASDEDGPPPVVDLFTASSIREVVLADLPSGRMMGNCIHKIFEMLDFRDTREEVIRPVVERECAHFGVDLEHAAALTTAVGLVLRTPLDASGLTLSEVAPGARLAEMDFVFPTRTDPGFDLSDLLSAFREHGGPHLTSWLGLLESGRFREVRGFLSGSIDLAFKSPRDGRWYVLDWKSNRLGRRASDYDRASMGAAMDHHHYHLQYHLYAVAFARYLRHRLKGFSLERDFGGVFYLFVRGLSPDHPPGSGVWFDRPSPALIEALDEVFSTAAGLTRQGRPAEVRAATGGVA